MKWLVLAPCTMFHCRYNSLLTSIVALPFFYLFIYSFSFYIICFDEMYKMTKIDDFSISIFLFCKSINLKNIYLIYQFVGDGNHFSNSWFLFPFWLIENFVKSILKLGILFVNLNLLVQLVLKKNIYWCNYNWTYIFFFMQLKLNN